MSGPPPPPPHGGVPKGSGLPPGKYDIFVIPEHSAGSGFLYLPSMQPNVNSFAAGFASALILVAVCQSMAPAFRAWWDGFQGLGNMGMAMIVIGVGFGAWSLGRIQQSGSSRKYGPSASWDGTGGYGGTSSRTSANTDGPRPPPHGNSTPPPPPQNDTPPQPPPQQERSKNTWEGTPPQESRPPPKPDPDPEPEPPPRPQPKPQPPPQTPPETPPPKPKPNGPQTPLSAKAEPPKSKESSWEKAREETRKKEEERKVKEAEQKRRDDAARRLAELRAREAKERQERDKERQRREREAREQEEQRQRYAQEKEEIKQREAKERRERLEAEKRAKDLAEKLEHERKEREKYEKEAREIREAAAAKAAAEAKAAREEREREDQKQREAREREEKRQREIMEVEDKRKKDALEREERRRRLQKQREEMRKREAEEAARREEAKKKKDEEELAKKEAEAAVREAEAAVRARAEAAANSQAEADERTKTLAKARAEAEAQAQARKGSSYAYSSVGERTSMWPNGRPPVLKSTTSTSTTSTTKPPPTTAPSSAPTSAPTSAPSNGTRKPPTSSAPRSNVSSSQTETTARSEDHSYRPYDKVRARRKMSVSSMTGSESSWAGTHTTSRTSPPPSVRGPYTTNDPDKIVISGVYLFMNQYAKTPASQLISGLGSVTDGLILRITTEGLFIDDDVRGVPQREWDVKAWTLKLTEVWCPPHCLNNPTAAAVPAAKPNPLFKMASSRPRDRGATKPFTGEEADGYLAEMMRSCKDCCKLGLCDRKFRDTSIPSSNGVAGEWKAKGLHVLRATVRDQEGKRYVFVVDETEGWKLAMGLHRLRRGTQVRQLGVSGMAASDARGTLEMLGWT